MAKFRDKLSIGTSEICPKIDGEHPKVRHIRRKHFNLQFTNEVRAFCAIHNLRFSVKNFGYHWMVSQKGKNGKLVEWWPSTAKVVINKRFSQGIHVHDYRQFIEIIKKELLGKDRI